WQRVRRAQALAHRRDVVAPAVALGAVQFGQDPAPNRRDAEDRRQAVALGGAEDRGGIGAGLDDDRPADQDVREDNAIPTAGVGEGVDDEADGIARLPRLEGPGGGGPGGSPVA